MKHGGRQSTRNHLGIEGKGEEDTIRQSQKVPQILSWILLNLIVILTLIYPRHPTLVLPVMISVRRERDLLKETNIDGEKEVINAVIEGERSVIKDQSAGQEDHQIVPQIQRQGVKVKVALVVMALMLFKRIRSKKIAPRRLVQNFPRSQKILCPPVVERGRKNPPRRMEHREAMALKLILNLTEVKIDNLTWWMIIQANLGAEA